MSLFLGHIFIPQKKGGKDIIYVVVPPALHTFYEYYLHSHETIPASPKNNMRYFYKKIYH